MSNKLVFLNNSSKTSRPHTHSVWRANVCLNITMLNYCIWNNITSISIARYIPEIVSNQIKSNQIKSLQIKSLLLSHHHSTSALVSEILTSVLQTVQKKKKILMFHWFIDSDVSASESMMQPRCHDSFWEPYLPQTTVQMLKGLLWLDFIFKITSVLVQFIYLYIYI